MKHSVKIIVALTVLVLMVGMLAGCGGGSIVGKWKPTEALFIAEFNSDGSCSYQGLIDMRWKQSGDRIIITDDIGNSYATVKFSINGDELTLGSTVYKRIS